MNTIARALARIAAWTCFFCGQPRTGNSCPTCVG